MKGDMLAGGIVGIVVGVLCIAMGLFADGFSEHPMPGSEPKKVIPMSKAGRVILVVFGLLILLTGIGKFTGFNLF